MPFFIILLWLVRLSHGWYMDVSCYEKHHHPEHVLSWMKGAFDLIDVAFVATSELNEAIRQRTAFTDLTPVHRAQHRALHQLLSGATTSAKNIYRMTLNTATQWEKVRTKFEVMQKYKDSAHGEPQDLGLPADHDGTHRYQLLTNKDVVVYCDLGRFMYGYQCLTWLPNPGWACDVSVMIDFPVDRAFTQCMDPSASDIKESVWAQPSSIDGIPLQIQICERFFTDQIQNRAAEFKKLQVFDDVSRAISAYQDLNGPPVQRWQRDNLDRPPIDMALQGDTTMLHALLTALPDGANAVNVEGDELRGWGNAIRLSKEEPRKAIDNASNYVFFALACRMALPEIKFRISDQGKFVRSLYRSR
ncbi:hypothetical protein QQS21_003658 [Conoideocrella luteorostrata]|uniref:Uncharacterized protein n=1 Tax=Conoideocrella luteorostrata TaxID=1105319 RepID=A0AAJ0CSV5_9HYPO|nr:hypothetical protein QQS21_003658 [Conoideocrella luteorostrata]